MGFAQKILPNYTYTDYLRWKRRWEIIDGIAFNLKDSFFPIHQRVSSKVGSLFSNLLSKDLNYHIYLPIDLLISENTVVNPDLLIICEEVKGQYYDKAPELVVEIISPSSRLKDTITKYDLYEQFGIKYYVIVDPENNSVKCYQLTENLYKEIEAPYEFIISDSCKINVNFNNIF